MTTFLKVFTKNRKKFEFWINFKFKIFDEILLKTLKPEICLLTRNKKKINNDTQPEIKKITEFVIYKKIF